MAENIEQWYTMLQETCDKWSSEITRLESENKDGSLTKQINQIIPTLERYQYYLEQKSLEDIRKLLIINYQDHSSGSPGSHRSSGTPRSPCSSGSFSNLTKETEKITIRQSLQKLIVKIKKNLTKRLPKYLRPSLW
jgi:hypothetical protein